MNNNEGDVEDPHLVPMVLALVTNYGYISRSLCELISRHGKP